MPGNQLLPGWGEAELGILIPRVFLKDGGGSSARACSREKTPGGCAPPSPGPSPICVLPAPVGRDPNSPLPRIIDGRVEEIVEGAVNLTTHQRIQ